MIKKNPYMVVISRHQTEKANVLGQLKSNTSNASVKKCNAPKYVFIVNKNAKKQEIAKAVEEIYADRGVKVKGVNTITVKPKARRVRGRAGMKPGFKKAIVTLDASDSLDEV